MLNAETVRYNKTLDRAESNISKNNRIIRYFADVHLGNGHKGLSELALKHGIRINDLEIGEFVMFVNKDQTGLKLFSPGNIVCYLKMPGSHRINPRTITLLPKFFNGSEINYNKALTEAMKKYYKN